MPAARQERNVYPNLARFRLRGHGLQLVTVLVTCAFLVHQLWCSRFMLIASQLSLEHKKAAQ